MERDKSESDKNIYLISSQLREFMLEEQHLNEDRIVALELRLRELFDAEYVKGRDDGYSDGYDDGWNVGYQEGGDNG